MYIQSLLKMGFKMLKTGGFEKEEAGQRLFMEGDNCFVSTSSNCPNCIYLYNWSLLRVSGGHCENSIARNGVQIALEGSRTSDLLDCDKFRTAPIESRIEKCKLRTITGMNILLRGAIDEQHTHENGFSFQVINLFLTGFPYNWNHVINECCRQPSLNGSVLPVSKENYAQQEKDEGLNSHHSGMRTGEGVTVISISLNAEEKKCKGNKSTSKIISREALVRGCSRGRYGSPVQLSKRLKCCNSIINHKPIVLSPSVELPENPNILKEFVSNLSMGTHTAPVEKKDMAPKQMHSCKETYEIFDKDDHLIESGSKLLREKPFKVSVTQEDKYFVERNKAMKYNVRRSMKEMRESRKQFYSGISLDEAELTQSMYPGTKEDGDENQTNSHFDCSGDSAHQIIDMNETEQSPAENVHSDQMKSNCTSQGQRTKEIQKPVSKFAGTGCKTGRPISSDKSQTKRNKMSKSSQASRDELCGEITDETVTGLSNVTCHENITSAGEECKNYSLFPSNPDSGLISNEITRNMEDVKEQIEKNCLADVPDFEFLCIEKNISSASAGNKPTPLPGIHLNNNVNKSVKQKKNLSTEKRGRSKTRTRQTDQSPTLFETFMCNQTNVNDDVMVKCNDMDATCDANPHQVASEIEDGMTSKNCSETGSTCWQGNGDGKEGSMQIPKSIRAINMQTQPNKRQLSDNIPPSPQCCVHATFEELSTENGKQPYSRKARSAKCSDVYLGQMKNKSTSGQQTQIQKPVSEFLGTGCKTGKLISLDKSQTNRNRNNKSSQASRGELNGEIADETVKELSNVTSRDKITSTGDERESYNLSPSDPEFELSCNEINSPGEDGKGQIQIQTEVECLADVDKLEFISSSFEENKPISLTENHPNNDVNKSVKQLNNSSTKKRGSSKTCQERNGNGEKGSMQMQETSTKINSQTQTNKKQLSNNIPPTPRSRVHTTPEEVSKAFGLKTSKSGRLLVPPLAHWCNQAIAYDVDGGIIAILDASSERDEDSGRLFFTPPEQKDAVQMQKKLRNAANNWSRSKILKK